MESQVQARPAARSARRGPIVAVWVAVGLAVQAALTVLDVVSSDKVVFTTTFVLVPFALAIIGRWRVTAFAAALAVALSIASGFWDHYAFSDDHLLRITIVTAGGLLAVLAAWALGRAAEERRRMTVLAAVGRLSGAETLEAAVAGLEEALVPSVADRCWIDVDEPDGTMRRVLGEGEPRPVARDEPERARLFHGAGVTGAIVPVASGRLGLETSHPAYDADDLAFFGILAGRVSLVLANARLVTDLRSIRARLDGILESLAEAVTVHDEEGQTVYANAAAARLLGRASPDEVMAAKPGELGARFAITREDGSPVAIADLPGRRLIAGEPAPSLLTRSVDRTTGEAYWLLTKATTLDDQGRRYAVNIIEDVTHAKEAELRQRFLAQAGQLLASSLDYQETLARVAMLAVPWLADWCAVDLPDDHGGIHQVALAHADPTKIAMAEELRSRFPPDPEAATGVPGVLKGGPAELYPKIPDELLSQAISDPEQLEAIRALGMRAVMIVPMRIGDTTLGAITLISADSGRTFDEDDFAFAQDLALRAAWAIQNARLYAEQVRVAHTLQASLLPERLSEIPGWLSAAAYQAGEQGADVGGDFYDIVAVGGGRHLVFLGDVTGKGIEAAALTSLVRHSVRTAARFDPRPAKVLELVDAILVEQPKLAPVTLVCALIDHDRLTVASGGHPPALLRRGDAVRELGPGGVVLGAIGGLAFPETTYTLEPGDTLVLYTDGVTDTPGTNERFGHERLAGLLTHAPEAPGEIIEQIDGALRAFQTGTAIDDRAILVLRFTGTAAAGLRSVA